jgi:hypothetical protein
VADAGGVGGFRGHFIRSNILPEVAESGNRLKSPKLHTEAFADSCS